MAPLSRIQATATEVSRPPEKAIPTRSPTGRDVKTLDTGATICTNVHNHQMRRVCRVPSVRATGDLTGAYCPSCAIRSRIWPSSRSLVARSTPAALAARTAKTPLVRVATLSLPNSGLARHPVSQRFT